LKQLNITLSSSNSNIFPRLKKRGPIEALYLLLAVHTFDRFPRLKKRGPIEAMEDWQSGTKQHYFRA